MGHRRSPFGVRKRGRVGLRRALGRKYSLSIAGYAVVPDIESLPSRITTLYRRLTE
jgi:hypothetical protein